jgi:hypothetical protein
MSTGDTGVSFEEMDAPTREGGVPEHGEKSAADLEAVFDVPVRISVVLGRARDPGLVQSAEDGCRHGRSSSTARWARRSSSTSTIA